MSDLDLPLGFRWSGHHSGIKTDVSKPDYALVASDCDAVCVGVYTQNLVRAAPVLWCQKNSPNSKCRAVVVNSGNANACTGKKGAEDTLAMAEDVARELGLDATQVMVMSTGLIGSNLPMEKIGPAASRCVMRLNRERSSFLDAAQAILTTDQGKKICQRELQTSQGIIRLAAIAKGAGMIGPDMATMLACVMTDASLETNQAQAILKRVADKSFNCVSVEGHTSTNDTLLLLANGVATEDHLNGEDLLLFESTLESAMVELAKQIPADGEGSTHLIEIEVDGASSGDEAKIIAQTVASSNLVKTCVAGADPNWGRVVSAVGYAGVALDVRDLSLKINGNLLFENGEPRDFDEIAVSSSMRDCFDTKIELVVGHGEGHARVWTSDLNCEYVRFNSDYHT